MFDVSAYNVRGYTMYRGAPELFRPYKEIRELIIEWVEQHREIPAEPTGNWRMVVPESEK